MLTLILSLLVLTPAHANALAEDAIYRGTAVGNTGQAWKSSVKLEYNGTMCSGVFMTEDTILTAAHCPISNVAILTVKLFRDNNPASSDFIDLEPGEFTYTKHPRYRPVGGGMAGVNDIAVVVLKNKSLPEGFSPAELQTSSDERASDPGETAFMVGAGLKGDGNFADRLFFSKGSIRGYQNGSVMIVEIFDRQGICGGDSGGPVFVSVNGRLKLAGVINSTFDDIGKECGTTVNITTITAEIYNWIQSKR